MLPKALYRGATAVLGSGATPFKPGNPSNGVAPQVEEAVTGTQGVPPHEQLPSAGAETTGV